MMRLPVVVLLPDLGQGLLPAPDSGMRHELCLGMWPGPCSGFLPDSGQVMLPGVGSGLLPGPCWGFCLIRVR